MAWRYHYYCHCSMCVREANETSGTVEQSRFYFCLYFFNNLKFIPAIYFIIATRSPSSCRNVARRFHTKIDSIVSFCVFAFFCHYCCCRAIKYKTSHSLTHDRCEFIGSLPCIMHICIPKRPTDRPCTVSNWCIPMTRDRRYRHTHTHTHDRIINNLC